VRGADRGDPALVPQPLEQVELLPPGDQVVDLVEVDVAVPAERALGLAAALGRRRGPDLGRDQRQLAPAEQRRAQQLLCPAVHRRGVDQVRAGVDGGHDEVRGRLATAPGGGLQPLPGPETDRWDVEARRAELASLHGR
jgi:hypothetical protein